MASIDYAAMLYRQKPGVKVTYDAWHYIERVTGHELQLTNSDESLVHRIYLHENRLCILDATAGRDEGAAHHLPAVVRFPGCRREAGPVPRLLLQSSSSAATETAVAHHMN